MADARTFEMEGQLRKYGTLTLYRRLILEARPYWPHVLAFLVLNLLATPLALLVPVPLKIAVDSVIGSRPLPRAMQMILPAAWQRSNLSLLFLVGALVVVFALLT